MSQASTNMSPNRSKTVRQVTEEIAHVLSAADVPSPVVDARELIAFVVKVPRNQLALVTWITAEQQAEIRIMAGRRAQRVPLQHLTGSAPFRYLDLAVGPGVFIPRPETEPLVGWGLDAIAGLAAPLVVDLCAGSGAIALSVAREHPGAVVVAVEQSAGALPWLRRNAAATPVKIIEGDAVSAATLRDLDGQVDAVLSNPPYVPCASTVPPEVSDHDPAAAVFAGADGLDVIRGLVVRAAALLKPSGVVAVEHDDGHGVAVPDLLRRTGAFGDVADHDDLTGRPRFATARRLAD
ncbi:peptide chain release factor N(5)-glutamine methyltransferase [Virgisporangium aurantiacum]|uniref:peptide chain release factor N(5)-glutamine methyltransferase n=1 Tax=Virgisporangium aurantiacum TaxID=175570 RepID=UPI001EF335D0|nr:peptide chain release factor N(5)-glutamine methyltransferase [Virgisporangium aurantiacum]